MKTTRVALLTLVLLSLPGLAFPAAGFYIGTGAGIAFPSIYGDFSDQLQPDSGFVWEPVHLGYNFTDYFGLSMQWGMAAGETEYSSDITWAQEYLDLSARIIFNAGNQVEPYGELGVGAYFLTFMDDETTVASDPEPGIRIAAGANINLHHLYLAPEVSYHYVKYNRAEVDEEGFDRYDIVFDETGEMILFLFKIGYQWGD
jgi:hypothetical protein